MTDLRKSAEQKLDSLLAKPRVQALVAGIADHAPYLWRLIETDPSRLARLLDDDPEASLQAICASLENAPVEESEAEIMQRLRLAKQEVALLVALADTGGVWGLEPVVQALSRAADLFIQTALSFLLRKAHAAKRLSLADPENPQDGCGLVVLGLGKLGGCELNYSSDVDLIVIFDPERSAVIRHDEVATCYVRIVRDLVRLLQQATADGYVLRVDLRLRPDPSSTAIAIGIGAAFVYYEAFGQNWERAAMIKARPVAGDLALGHAFIDGLSPFIWRRYFDYAAIADIHAMKRQIHAAKGHAEIAVAGHNVKVGRGGIREIEFFVQTQQLIFGGKQPNLRGSRTLLMLRQLRREGWVGSHAVADLTRAYDFLRRVEHRLQMVADEQTHRLPQSAEQMGRFARFCGFASTERFAAVLTRHLRCVVHHYALLFEGAPQLDDAVGSLVFTGVGDDPETIETLMKLGYAAPETVSATVRAWHSGKRIAVRSSRARETLTELVPRLLVTLGKTSDPNGAIAAFDTALESMPAAGELFAILSANAALRSLFGEILGSAPRLAAAVTLHPHLLDIAISPVRMPCLDEDEMTTRLAADLTGAQTVEDLLDAIRDIQHEEHFLIGVRLLSGDLDPSNGGLAYSALATAVIRILLDKLLDVFATDHGRVDGGAMAVVAMGKLGSREMTATSDLDLVLIYDFDDELPDSDGRRPLHANQYYGRLSQRLISYLTVATRRGMLYQVDTRLRPSGRQGPLASKLSAFANYQATEAASWEHMALTRARVVAGDAGLADCIAKEIAGVFRRSSSARVAEDVSAMRGMIEREKPPRDVWDFKLLPGGLIDIEFLAQFFVLKYALDFPEIAATATHDILRVAKRLDLMNGSQADRLLSAHALYANTTQIMRLALDDAQDVDRAGEGFKDRLAAAAGSPGFPRLKNEIVEARQAVREIFLGVLSAR